LAQGQLDPAGNATLTLPGLAPGTYAVRARVPDVAGTDGLSAVNVVAVVAPALRLPFEPAPSQGTKRIGPGDFLAHGRNSTIAITPTGVSLATAHTPTRGDGFDFDRTRSILAAVTDHEVSTVVMRLDNANGAAQSVGMDLLPGVTNYLLGNDPSAWRT